MDQSRRHDEREMGLSEKARNDRRRAEEEVAERHMAERTPDPHHELTNPAEDPDLTEYPDPYERRPDPRDPSVVDTPAMETDPEDAAGRDAPPHDPSTSDPSPPRNTDRARSGEGEER